MHHRYQRHRWQICHWCQRHRRQNCRRYQRHRGQICHRCDRWQTFPPFSLALLIPLANLPPVSTIPAANLPSVSTTPVANCHRYQRHRRKICHRWQIMATISGCRHLKVNLKAKIYIQYMLTLLPKGVQTKLLKFFCLKFFSICHRNLELHISPRIFEKIRNGPNGIIRGLGETDSRKKTRSKKSRDTVPLRC